MKIKAFKGLRPKDGLAKDIASLPYDVVNFKQACKEAEGKPLSFMRVVRSELELDPGIDPYTQAVYDHAKENFEKLVKNGHLIREDAPSMYLYRQQMGSHSQTGIVATFSAQDYDADVVEMAGWVPPVRAGRDAEMWFCSTIHRAYVQDLFRQYANLRKL